MLKKGVKAPLGSLHFQINRMFLGWRQRTIFIYLEPLSCSALLHMQHANGYSGHLYRSLEYMGHVCFKGGIMYLFSSFI